MNLFSIALLLLLIPSIIQVLFGSLALKNKIKFPFEFITLFNCIGQFIFIYLALKIIEIDTQNQNIKCGMPQAAMFFCWITIINHFVDTNCYPKFISKKE